MNEKERLLKVLHLEEIDRVPCICPMQTGTIDLMKASLSFWPEAHHDPEKMAKLALAANRVTGLESVRVPFEVAVDASAFGVEIHDRRMRNQPMILGRRIKSHEDFLDTPIPDPSQDGMVPVVLQAIERIKEEAPNLPLICGMVAPHMLAFQLLGEDEAAMLMEDDPVFLRATLQKAKAWTMAYAQAAVDAGADVIALVDSIAGSAFMTADEYLEWALPFHRRVTIETEKLDVPVIAHVCGNATEILPLVADTGAMGVSFDHHVSIPQAKEVLAGKTALIGNLSPTKVLLKGRPRSIEAKTKEIIEEGIDAVSPGCGLFVATPTENIKAMVDATKLYGRRE